MKQPGTTRKHAGSAKHSHQGHAKHNPSHQHQHIADHKAQGQHHQHHAVQHPHKVAKPKPAPKTRQLALGSAVACCSAEALAASLRLAGWPVTDADTYALNQ